MISQAEVDVILDDFEVALLFLVHHPHDAIGNVSLLSTDEAKRLHDAHYDSHKENIQTTELWSNGFPRDHDITSPRSGPKTELQAQIRSLWASLLRLNEGSLGIDDDFYTAGGDSVSAIHLARASRGAGIALSVTDIIRNPTVRAMAKIAESTVINHEFDDDEIPSKSLDQMAPDDLTLLDLDGIGLESLREELLEKHGLPDRKSVV